MSAVPSVVQPPAFLEGIVRAFKHDRVTELAGALSWLAGAGSLDDPKFFSPPREERYARRLIWREPRGRFVVIGMTWAPGQYGALHDHAGLCGAEIVVSGVMRERTYRLLERDHLGRHLFARDTIKLHRPGSVGALVPPLEYHEFGNAGDSVARTLHVYGGDLDRCTSFSLTSAGWWTPATVDLRYDG